MDTSQTWKDSRRRREFIVIGLILVVTLVFVVASARLGVAAFGMTVENKKEINKIQDYNEDIRRKMDKLEARVFNSEENILNLKDVKNTINKIEEFYNDYESFKDDIVEMNFLISHIIGKLIVGKAIMDSSRITWILHYHVEKISPFTLLKNATVRCPMIETISSCSS